MGEAFKADAIVQQFISSGDTEKLLPATLTAAQRALVHNAARLLGVNTATTGVAPMRVLKLEKVKTASGEISASASWLQKAEAAEAAALAAALAAVPAAAARALPRGRAAVASGEEHDAGVPKKAAPASARKAAAANDAKRIAAALPAAKKARAAPRVRG